MEARLRPLVKGALSFYVPSLRTFHQPLPASTATAEYCYSMFLRHLSYVTPLRPTMPAVVAEFGPGSSIGMGLAALIAGARTYYGLDIVDHTDRQRNLEIFDRLAALFRAQTPIPADGVNADTFPLPASWAFPDALAADAQALFSDARLAAIRADLADGAERFVRMRAPWTSRSLTDAGGVDWIMSQSVLMYVDDPAAVIDNFKLWLAPDGVMTHEIDYTCSALTRHWNGHWALSDLTMRMMRGRRPHLLNRLPHSAYVRLFEERGYRIAVERRDRRDPALPARRFAAEFRDMSAGDQETAEGFLVCVPA
jgi:hypothetical protein